MKPLHIFLIVFAVFFAFTALLLPVSAEKGGAHKEDGKVRVFTSDHAVAVEAQEAGCELKKQGKKAGVFLCTAGVASALGLQEDLEVFALGEQDRGRQKVSSQSASANTQIGANTVHASGNTGAGRVVVVLDTGYNYLHPELAGASYGGGWDFVNNDNNPMDDN